MGLGGSGRGGASRAPAPDEVAAVCRRTDRRDAVADATGCLVRPPDVFDGVAQPGQSARGQPARTWRRHHSHEPGCDAYRPPLTRPVAALVDLRPTRTARAIV